MPGFLRSILGSGRRSAKPGEEGKFELERAKAALAEEAAERRRAEAEARRLKQELEDRVAERTKELSDANRELRKNEAKLRAFLESASQGILAVDTRGRIQLVNAQLEQVFGYRREELLNQPLSMLLPRRYEANHDRFVSSYFANPRRRPMGLGLDLAGMKKDGTEFPLEISLSYTGEGEDRLALAFITDITDRKRTEEHLRETAKLESLGVLAGGIAHDFNNLLVGVMGNASLALDSLPASEQRLQSMLEGILKASERAADLIRQLLAYSGKGRFVLVPVNVSALIRETVRLIQASVEKNVSLQLELAETPPIEADPSQIQQLVMNLVINGAEAIGERNGAVIVRTSTEGGNPDPGACRVRLVVEDNGAGMDDATRGRIFEPFFTTKFTGRGLGLAAVQGIVRGQRGDIKVESEPGKGTRISVSFPASRRSEAPSEVPRSRGPQARGTVLVIDDEEVVRSTARMALEQHGYGVLTAENGRQGLELFRGHVSEIAAIVLDLTMPVLSGVETLRQLRAIRPDVNVILSSGYDEVEAVRRFQGQSVAGFLQKPYTGAALIEAVGTVLSAPEAPGS